MEKPIKPILKDLTQAVLKGAHEHIENLILKALNEKVETQDILKALQKATTVAGNAFIKKEMSFSDMLVSVGVKKQAVVVLEQLAKAKLKNVYTGIFTVGTAKGNVHDIGKNIVTVFAECRGFKVVDLGVDIDHEEFVDATREHRPGIVGISGILANINLYIPYYIDEFRKVGLGNKLLLSISGPPVIISFMGRYGILLFFNKTSQITNAFVNDVRERVGIITVGT